MSFDLTAFLTAFGYLRPGALVGDAIAQAEAAYGLPQTGDPANPQVERVFAQTPRCGVSDAEGLADGQAYWGLKQITWFAESVPQGVGLNRTLVETAIQEAFNYWSEVCPLKFVKADTSAANIIFRVGRGSRSDFDGPGGTLAWMEVCSRPKYTGTLNGAFDGDESWVVVLTSAGIRLVNVACHEIGHALGFMHSRRGGQLMSPTYARELVKPQSEDIARVQAVYGKPVTEPGVPPTPTLPSAPAKTQILMGDGSIYEFSNPKKLR